MIEAALWKALILGVVEGLTEFLPVSSTGHLILAGDLLDFRSEQAKVFYVVIQTGAMLAVIWEYRERFTSTAPRFWLNLGIAFLPAAVLGVLLGDFIKAYLFHPVAVAAAFIAGGFIILWVERPGADRRPRVESTDAMTWLDALKVGIAQCFALIPGTSRAGATIIGGMLFGLSRPAAVQFSFFLAVPTLVGAGAWDFLRHRELLSSGDTGYFLAGGIMAFVSAFAVIRWLIRYVATHDFRPFAWYRIGFGIVVLVTASTGAVDWGGM
jgi:undecaprenyl-diphosphatase